ncbi:MAG: hypothetical protein JO300_07370 [Silvibacterium sp.]|nr:hypothetical protein [Silvibacterium sp.]MBV8438929.1 hypothetical protein [Silvibacterium sp.]
MNPYLFIHRIKGPAMLLVFGITALLHEWDILSFGRSWPLYLIVLGVLQLAERAAWSQHQQQQYTQGAYAGPGTGPGVPGTPGGFADAPSSSSIVVSPPSLPDDPNRRFDQGEGR